LSELGIEAPHVVGNSLGGWIALELAAITPVSSLTLLSPAGLWRDRTPLYCRVSLTASRLGARHAGPVLRAAAGFGPTRWAMLRQSTGRPLRMTSTQVREAIADLGRAAGFGATFRATFPRAYVAVEAVEVPISVSFGTRDLLLLPRQSRHLERLPAHTVVAPIAGTGHVPMTDDPQAVAALVRRTAQQSPPHR
jgi:pimeloyl-ACP methyl ester carboxylesterase